MMYEYKVVGVDADENGVAGAWSLEKTLNAGYTLIQTDHLDGGIVYILEREVKKGEHNEKT